jgi:hypothetical protein
VRQSDFVSMSTIAAGTMSMFGSQKYPGWMMPTDSASPIAAEMLSLTGSQKHPGWMSSTDLQ